MTDRHFTRRNLAKGVAWSTPTLVIGASAPALAASTQDVAVGKLACSDASGRNSNIPFTVTTVGGAVLPIGTVFTVSYAGGSNRPTWNGSLADNSTATIQPGDDTSINGGRYGTIKFTLRNPMPANSTWNLNVVMDIGSFITGQYTSLALTSSIPSQNRDVTNDSASHEMRFGRCRE